MWPICIHKGNMFYMPDRNLYIYGSDHNKLCYNIDLISILSYVIDFYIGLSFSKFYQFIFTLRQMLIWSFADEYEIQIFLRERIVEIFHLTQRWAQFMSVKVIQKLHLLLDAYIIRWKSFEVHEGTDSNNKVQTGRSIT